MTVPQLLLTLSPSGTLQIELPGPNGSRRVVPLDGSPEAIISNLTRLLIDQTRGLTRIGQSGAPTAHQMHHQLRHSNVAPTDGCPFCNLGLRHSNNQCGLSSSAKRKKARTVSDAFKAAYAAPINPEELGI